MSKKKSYKMGRHVIILCLFYLITFTQVYAQTGTIDGTVTTDEGQPLPGVTVSVKGTGTGTITNEDG